ncbi:MAG TPA: radical SAM protein [Pyrinomonadaceae bacterium]|jgi:MoaA/NifB/PqqE/SkfB family radical SAM enzyme|nr:radical SAM protein [Pyrinomonadaceae bacterium]
MIVAAQSVGEARDYGPPRLIVELTNICNLHCSYCLRDDDALYHTPANFFPVELLRRILKEARASVGVEHLMLTGGEATLHPRFEEIIKAAADEELTTSFVTNGWHFERVWPMLEARRESVSHVAFSLDGATRDAHDRWRGEGSFVRLVRAFTRCRMSGFPFMVKVGIRRDTIPQFEQIAMFAARMGAAGLSFAHILPTSSCVEDESALSLEERRLAEQEIADLARVFKMRVRLDVGYYNLDDAAPCSALEGTSFNIDYRGHLSLCCNLSGYRGAVGEADVVADLKVEDFADAYARLRGVADAQTEKRRLALAAIRERGEQADLYTGSPCLFCLQSFDKIPWRAARSAQARALPILTTSTNAARGGRITE